MPIPRTSKYGSNSFLRPKEDIDPNKKSRDPKYALAYSKFIYSMFMTNNTVIKSHHESRLLKNRSYAEGRQDTSIYKNWILGTKSEAPKIPVADDGTRKMVNSLQEEELGLENVNFDEVFSPLPKYVENVIGIMRSIDHDVLVDATDERSGTLREEVKYMSYVKNQTKALLAKYNAIFELSDSNEEKITPSSIMEMELFENVGAFKLPYEIAMEKAISHVHDENELDSELKDKIIADFMTDNMSCLVTIQDAVTGKAVPKRKDVLDVVLESGDSPTYGGYIEYYTAHKLRIETGWKEERIFKLCQKHQGSFGNTGTANEEMNDSGDYNYDDYKIPILHCYWKAIDSEYYSDRDTDRGPMKKYESYRRNGSLPPKDRKDRKLTKTDIRRLYECKWILDSEEVFGYGIVTNSPYDFGKSDVVFPITIKKLTGKPKIESMIPIEDQIYLSFIKMQNAIAKAAPPGIAVEYNSIKNITYGNKKLTPKDMLRVYTTSGNLIYQVAPTSIPGQRSYNAGKPIEHMPGGLGTAITDGFFAIEKLYNQLDIVTGIDGLTSNTLSPSRDTGKAISEMAMAATSNTLKPIYNGFLKLKTDSAKVTAWTFQASLSAYEEKELDQHPYYNALGLPNIIAVKAAGNFPPCVYGFKIEARATEQEKAKIEAAAQAGLQSGKNGIPALTFSEYSFVVRYLNTGHSIKYLELWISKKEQDRAAEDAAKSEQMIAAQAEEQRKTDENNAVLEIKKAESEINKEVTVAQAKADAEKEKEIAVTQAKGKQDRATEELQHKNKMELLGLQIKLKEKEKSNLSVNN